MDSIELKIDNYKIMKLAGVRYDERFWGVLEGRAVMIKIYSIHNFQINIHLKKPCPSLDSVLLFRHGRFHLLLTHWSQRGPCGVERILLISKMPLFISRDGAISCLIENSVS